MTDVIVALIGFAGTVLAATLGSIIAARGARVARELRGSLDRLHSKVDNQGDRLAVMEGRFHERDQHQAAGLLSAIKGGGRS